MRTVSFELKLIDHARHSADIITPHKDVAVRGKLHVALRTSALEHSASASATIGPTWDNLEAQHAYVDII